MIRRLRALRRLAFGVAVLAATLAHLRVASALRASPREQSRRGRRWAARVNRALGLRVESSGLPPRDPALVVANHRSWTDILALLELVECTFLAKCEMGRWPLFGALARELHTVFVERECKRSRRLARAELAARLEGGALVALFPEGTTTRCPGLLPFQPGMFWTAAERKVPVVPVALHYDSADDAWVGDDTLLRHFFARFAGPPLRVRVAFGPPLRAADGEALRRAAETWIADSLASGCGAQGAARAPSWEEWRDDDDRLPGGAALPARPLAAARRA